VAKSSRRPARGGPAADRSLTGRDPQRSRAGRAPSAAFDPKAAASQALSDVKKAVLADKDDRSRGEARGGAEAGRWHTRDRVAATARPPAGRPILDSVVDRITGSTFAETTGRSARLKIRGRERP